MTFIKAIFLPIMPPKNYSLNDRNFEREYEEMKKQYLKQQGKSTSQSSSDEKWSMPLRSTFR